MATSNLPNDHVHDIPKPITSDYAYPFAAAPDIIRSNQKDAYFQGVLLEQLSTILRRLYGSRFSQTYNSEARTFTELIYLGLTTSIGNRTLGEEYCDVYQIESQSRQLPTIGRRTGYILSAVLVPYTLSKLLPSLRSRIRFKLESNLSRAPKSSGATPYYRLQYYLLENLSTITSVSTSPIYAIFLAVFYFTGSYYQLSKRLFGLRYIFSKRLAPTEQRVGYEVLGVLLVLQIAVQAYLHVQNTITTALPTEESSAFLDDGVEIGLKSHQRTQQANELLEPPRLTEKADTSRNRISVATHTPLHPSSLPRFVDGIVAIGRPFLPVSDIQILRLLRAVRNEEPLTQVEMDDGLPEFMMQCGRERQIGAAIADTQDGVLKGLRSLTLSVSDFDKYKYKLVGV
ncbi:MAG: peroxisome bioproteinsis factor 10 [Alectoria sarmentosa]|nr:MAG: peroxisome bioproteinsis factor 10 [Alectoria sarmentosa]